MRTFPTCDANKTARVHAPAANTDAVITVAANSEQFHVVDMIVASLTGTIGAPAALTVVAGSTTLLSILVNDQAPVVLGPMMDLHNNETKNEALVITLAAGGASATGRIFALTK